MLDILMPIMFIITGLVVFTILCWFIVLCCKVDEIHDAMGLGDDGDEEMIDE